MEEINSLWHQLTDSEAIIQSGLLFISLVVFAETGLFFAFFLPGDYLLFLTGVFGGTAILKESLTELLIHIFLAACLGTLVGFLTGRYFGTALEGRKDSIWFKRKHLDSTRMFFNKHGQWALIISKFLPVVRTFTPILAGIIKMSWPRFLFLNVLGSGLWVGILVSSGFYLGSAYPWIIDYVHYIILFFLAVTTYTLIRGIVKLRND